MPSSLHVITPPTAEKKRPVRGRGLLYPLDLTYKRAGLEEPGAETISPGSILPPYRDLLAHDHSMTTTLERHFGVQVALRTMFAWSRGPWYFRRIVLAREDSGRPIEMGAVHINLETVGSRIRAQILRQEIPIGRLLSDGPLPYRSRPRNFLVVTPNSEMMGIFWMREPRALYGRQTELTLGGRPIGDIVEILPLLEG